MEHLLTDITTLCDKGIQILDIAILIGAGILAFLSRQNLRDVGWIRPNVIPNRFIATLQGLPNYPTPEALGNLTSITIPNFGKLEQALYGMGIIQTANLQITTAYRSPEVNKLATGINDSLHLVGLAVDFSCPDPMGWMQYINAVVKSGKIGNVREVIAYPDYNMCHIGWYGSDKGGVARFYKKDVVGNIFELKEYA